MNKKKILPTGAAALVAISCVGISAFADSKTELKNSMDIKMYVDSDGKTVYEYTDVNGETRTSGTASQKLTTSQFDFIHRIMKVDNDDIVVTVTSAPSGGKTYFEIVSQGGVTIASSGNNAYGKGTTWRAKGIHGIFGVANNVRAKATVAGTYSFSLQW